MIEHHWYLRSTKLVLVTTKATVLLVSDSGAVYAIQTAHAQQWSRLFQDLANPLPGNSLRERLAAIAVEPATLRRLIDDGYLLESQDHSALLDTRDRMFFDNQGYDFVRSQAACRHLVVACSGSIVAGLMAPTLLSLLHSGFQQTLDVILTASAQRFLTPDLLESYGMRTWTDAFDRTDAVTVPHVQLGRSSDCILIMPATANALHRIANGACSDLLSLTVAAANAPVVISPAMNDTMWNHRAVQRNIQQLRDDNMFIIEPTLIFGAADIASQGGAMFGGHGTLWGGPSALKRTLIAVMQFASEEIGSTMGRQNLRDAAATPN